MTLDFELIFCSGDPETVFRMDHADMLEIRRLMDLHVRHEAQAVAFRKKTPGNEPDQGVRHILRKQGSLCESDFRHILKGFLGLRFLL